MKKTKTIALFLTLCMILSFSFVANASNNEYQIFLTSNGESYTLKDFDIYIEDFADTNFETPQEVIDYIYNIGSVRLKTRDTQYSIFGKSLTEDELTLLIQHPIHAATAYNCSQTAVSTAASLYSDCHSDGDLGNAFQHAYWVMLMYYNTSPTFAIDFAVAHENYDGNPTLHKTMDLHNNYAAYDYCVGLNNDDTNYSDDVITDFALYLMETGVLEYIIFDYEYVYHSIYYMATGRTKEFTRTADLYAYTNSTIPYNIPPTTYEVIPVTPDGPILRP